MCKFYIGYIKIHVSYAVKPQGCQYSNGGNQMQARDLKSIIESENHELKTQFAMFRLQLLLTGTFITLSETSTRNWLLKRRQNSQR